MNRVLFVCHGNICRSPMAESIFRHLVRQTGQEELYLIDSAALSYEEIGRPMDARAAAMLESHHIPVGHHHARIMTKADGELFDVIYYMDEENRRRLMALLDPKDHGKMVRLDADAPIDDPWYSGDFEGVFEQIMTACAARLEEEDAQTEPAHAFAF